MAAANRRSSSRAKRDTGARRRSSHTQTLWPRLAATVATDYHRVCTLFSPSPCLSVLPLWVGLYKSLNLRVGLLPLKFTSSALQISLSSLLFSLFVFLNSDSTLNLSLSDTYSVEGFIGVHFDTGIQPFYGKYHAVSQTTPVRKGYKLWVIVALRQHHPTPGYHTVAKR